jgi:hypothetical protein
MILQKRVMVFYFMIDKKMDYQLKIDEEPQI